MVIEANLFEQIRWCIRHRRYPWGFTEQEMIAFDFYCHENRVNTINFW